MSKFAVYGSLREGHGNNRMLQDSHLISREVLKGWDMYSLGSFPYVVRGRGKIVVEVYEITDREIGPIVGMEHGAGYRVELVNTSVGLAGLFAMPYPLKNYMVAVPGGDWTTYRQRTLQERMAAYRQEREVQHENATH